MIPYRLNWFVIVLTLATLCPSTLLFAQSPQARVAALVADASHERTKLVEIVNATTHLQLANNSPQSRIGEMIMATKQAMLRTADGKQVLEVLPRSEVEMEAFDEFMNAKDNEILRPLYRAFYSVAFKSVTKYPSFLHRIFQVSVEFNTKEFPDYDDIDWYCDQLATIHRSIPNEYEVALNSEEPKNRTFLRTCGYAHR